MDIFKKRGTAVTVFVLAVVIFSLIGCHRSLSKACAAVEDGFFDSALLADYGDHTCPGDQINACINYANRLLSVINGADALADSYAAVRDSRQALADAMQSGDISDIYAANQTLYQAVSDLDAEVQSGASLPESNDDYASIVSDFFSAQRVISASAYNDYVDDFIQTTIRPFPTNVLRALSFVSLPEKFA